ncbi:Mobile element protein [Richelia intracellularis]|nr:Mobile element protein [Richelia intracellularis]
MTWKGLYPILSLSKTVYQKGISRTKKAMKQVESRLQRNPLLPKWDILIQPLELIIYFSKITLVRTMKGYLKLLRL